MIGLRVQADPPIIFSPWYSWSVDEKLTEYQFPGVYALARFDEAPMGPADPLVAETIYIGETCGQTLGGRLHQFDRSAFSSKGGHSCGWTYASRFSDGDARLFFALFPVKDLPEDQAPFFIRHVERALIWNYVKKWKCAPCCNSK